jgi:hypothetical protein
MQIATFDEILERLSRLDAWLTSLGISPKKDRWHEAVLMVQRAKEQRKRIERGEPRLPIDNYMPGLFDAMEIYEVMRAFAADSSSALRTKLARALCGPISPLQEQPKNNAARNAMFELALAADWKLGGAVVDLGEPDITLRIDDVAFQVECKRPFYDHSVRANIKGGAEQLGQELDRPGNEKLFGIVAISLSRVFTRGDLACVAPAGEGRRVIREALANMIKEHKKKWEVKGFLDLHPHIVAVMFHLAVPWDVGGERLIHLSSADFVQAGGRQDGFRLLQEAMSKIYQRYESSDSRLGVESP